MKPAHANRFPHLGFAALLAAYLLLSVTVTVTHAQTLTSIATFRNGANYFSFLIQGTDGALYGTISDGSAHNAGSVFKVTLGGTLTTLHTFCSQPNCADGSAPVGALALGADGNFYGATAHGGASGFGTLFKITPAGAYNIIHSFNNSDGAIPQGNLVLASDGNFYGVAGFGGAFGYGTVFQATAAGTVTTLHSFDLTHGSTPSPGVIQGTDGNFYGTTAHGGIGTSCFALPCGVVYKITTNGVFKLLHNFNISQGDYPGFLVQASNGSFYGMTQYGGLIKATTCPLGCGTLYSITANGTYQTVYQFQHFDGGNSSGGLVLATDGKFYGESPDDPTFVGQIFTLTLPNIITEVVGLAGFGGGHSAVVQATDGNFYSTYKDDLSIIPAGVFRLSVGLGPFVSFVSPTGKVGTTAEILGQGFTGTSSVTFNGIPTAFTVVSDTYLTATVPTHATTGAVVVATPTAILTSNMNFRVTK